MEDYVDRLEAEIANLKAENERLKDILTARHIKFSPVSVEEIEQIIYSFLPVNYDGTDEGSGKIRVDIAQALHDRIYGKDKVTKFNSTYYGYTSLDKPKEEWTGGANKVSTEPKEYCTCKEYFGSYSLKEDGISRCVQCDNPFKPKPIKTEKIEPLKVILKPDHFQEDTEYMPVDENIEQLTNMINILIHRFNKKGE